MASSHTTPSKLFAAAATLLLGALVMSPLSAEPPAKSQTFEYIKAHMGQAPFFEKHQALVEFAVAEATRPGLFLEFGVARGKSNV